MPWTSPGTAVAGSVLTASFWNAQVKNNLLILKTSISDDGDDWLGDIVAGAAKVIGWSDGKFARTGVSAAAFGSPNNGAVNGLVVTNPSITGDAASKVSAQAGTPGTLTNLYAFSSSYTPAGYVFASGGALEVTGAGGLSIVSSHASGVIRLYAGSASALRWEIDATGHLLAGTDNTYDLGSAGALRPRTGYFGTSVVAPLFTGALTGNVTGNVTGDLTGNVTGNVTGRLTTTQGSIIASTPAYSHTVTWNNVAVAFVDDFRNITNTASAAGSKLIQWQVNGTDMLTLSPGGTLTVNTLLVTGGHTSVGPVTAAGFIAAPFTNTNSIAFHATNLSGAGKFGVESSAGAAIFAGSTAYATVLGTTVAKPLEFFTNNVKTMSIASSGAAVHTASANSDFALTVANNGSTNANGLYVSLGASSTGILARFDLNNVAYFNLSNAGVLTLSQLGSGTVTATSGVLSVTSDGRLKNIIGGLPYGLAEALKIAPILYTWRSESGMPTDVEEAGFDARAVAAIAPKVAPYNEDKNVYGLSDRGLIGILYATIGELHARITTLERRTSVDTGRS